MKAIEFSILGVPAHFIDFDSTVKIVQGLLDDGSTQKYIVALNAEKIMMARKNSGMMQILRAAHLLIPDGVGVSLASRILYSRSVPRVPGFDLFLALLHKASQNAHAVFLLGGHDEIVKTASSRLKQKYPGINIVGYHHGYFNNDGPVVDLVNRSKPDILFVGMGSPKQERWIYENIRKLNVKICFGVGGSFDVIAGKAKLAPVAVRNMGLEFVYRLIVNPKRLRRQLVFPYFLASLLATRAGLTRRHNS